MSTDPALSQAPHRDAERPDDRHASGRSARDGVAGGGGIVGTGTAVLALVMVLLLAVAASLALGARSIAPAEVWRALTDPVAGDTAHLVVRDIRVPRTLLGLVGGLALGVAGALMQGLTRNPIADPGLLGVNAGASLAVVGAISVLGIQDAAGWIWFAFGGAALATALVYGAASAGWEGATPVRLALIGAAVTAFATSLVTLVLLSDQRTLGEYRFWQVGSLAGRPASLVWSVVPFVVVGLVLALGSARLLDALALGDDVARGLGHSVDRGRLLVALAVVLLCGSAVSLVGPVAFVGLVAPHVARALVGPMHRRILLLSALIGPSLLLLADVVGRLVARPAEVEAGVVVAVIGAPVLLVVVRRARMAAA